MTNLSVFNVCHCHGSVKSNSTLRFVVVKNNIFFGHVQLLTFVPENFFGLVLTEIWSYLFGHETSLFCEHYKCILNALSSYMKHYFCMPFYTCLVRERALLHLTQPWIIIITWRIRATMKKEMKKCILHK